MLELRVQVNHFYDPPHSSQIRRLRDLVNDLYPTWQHIYQYPLRKFRVPKFDCPKCRLLLHQGKHSVLQATSHLMYRTFNGLESMISTYQCTN